MDYLGGADGAYGFILQVCRRNGDLVVRLIKFMVVGASGAVLSLTTLYLLTDIAGWHYLLSYLVCAVLSVSNNYLWHSLWTFKDKQSGFKGYIKYAAMSLSTLGVRELFLFILTDILGVWYMLSAVITIALNCLVNFALSRKFIWGKEKTRRESVS